jgi:SAM-dependent methyltransferase
MTTLFDEPSRDPLDFNRTPAWCVELLIPELGQPRTILDAGCGDGAIGEVLRWHMRDVRPEIVGVEIDIHRARLATLKTDPRLGGYPVYDVVRRMAVMDSSLVVSGTRPDLIISNPPFGLAALDFLKCAIARVRPGGTVAFLLPTHWDHDPDAKTEFARQRFLDSIRLPNGRDGYCKLAIVGGGKNPCRPAFRGGSGTATDRYAWFMFGEPWAGQPSRRLHAIPAAAESAQLEIT